MPTAPRHRPILAAAALAGLAAAALAGLAAVGCARAPQPVLEPLRGAATRIPVILVPGMTGTVLGDRETGRVAWGTGARLIWPHDGGYGMARPLGGGEDRLEPLGVIRRIRLAGIFTEPVYEPLIRLLAAHGYRLGDLGSPDPRDDLFPFPYDWRQDNVLAARSLAARLRTLREIRGDERLPVILICQSSACHLCRYLVKFGGATLEEAEEGKGDPRSWLDVRRLVLVGPSTGGSLRSFLFLHRGRTYIPIVGRTWRPETLFTYPSLFQDLPAHRRDLFLNPAGKALEIDLYAAANWRDYGWSIYGPEAQRRLARRPRSDLFGDGAERTAYLEGTLRRARRLQRLLARDADGFGDTRLHLIQNVDDDTPERAVVARTPAGWQTLFPGEPEISRRPALRRRAIAPGDGHATRESQLWLSTQEREALEEPFLIRAPHFEMILEPAAEGHLLEILDRARPGHRTRRR